MAMPDGKPNNAQGREIDDLSYEVIEGLLEWFKAVKRVYARQQQEKKQGAE